ncbi:MAG: hypothetical protein KF775_18780 [Cyclobacteriaceae bacterium]|nr:hypothetical protein [Cyclobacteriaceae bacterium]
MLKYLRLFLVFWLVSLSSLAYSQYRASEYLWSISDEILLVKVSDEVPDTFMSLMTCKSDVKVRVVEKLKLTRLPQDIETVHFVRLIGCDMKSDFPEEKKLGKDKEYIIFLLSASPGSIQHQGEPKITIYGLADLVLGIQESNDDLKSYLKNKQREKH